MFLNKNHIHVYIIHPQVKVKKRMSLWVNSVVVNKFSKEKDTRREGETVFRVKYPNKDLR